MLLCSPSLVSPATLAEASYFERWVSFLFGVSLGRVSVGSPVSDNHSDHMLTSVGRESVGEPLKLEKPGAK